MELENIEFGIEIEFTGLSKADALKAINKVFRDRGEINNTRSYAHVSYKGRRWTIVNDTSIKPEVSSKTIKKQLNKKSYSVPEIRSLLGTISNSIEEYRFELVTPICTTKDIPTIQNIIREFRRSGVLVNSSSGIHMHIGLQSIPFKTLLSFIGIVGRYEDCIYNIFNIESNRRLEYCRNITPLPLDTAKKYYTGIFKTQTLDLTGGNSLNNLKRRLASTQSNKYFLLNLKTITRLNTIEFRGFNSTIHAGKLKTYIYFILTLLMRANDCNGFHKGVLPKSLDTLGNLKLLYNRAYNYELDTFKYKEVKESFFHIEKRFTTNNYFKKY